MLRAVLEKRSYRVLEAAEGLTAVEEHLETPEELAVQAFLNKPFTADAVLTAIREAIDHRGDLR